jgi:hypothetical protein
MVKVFKYKGNHEAKKYIKKLEVAIERMIQKDPEFAKTYRPADNMFELKAQFDKYCIETTEIISETKMPKSNKKPVIEEPVIETEKSPEEKQEEEFTFSDEKPTNITNTKTTMEDEKKPATENQDNIQPDPLNRTNPIVREHVLNDSMAPSTDANKSDSQGSSFEEPKDFETAFELPEGEDFEEFGSKKKNKDKEKETKTSSSSPSQKHSEPINPGFDDMSNRTKNKKTRRLATRLVGIFCAILEEGIPVWITRDITPAALARLAQERQIDLGLMLELDGNVQMSVAQFFAYMCDEAKKIGKLTEEQKEDLIDDLYDVLLEKGVTPSPIQSLLIGLAEVGLSVGIKIISIRTQINEVKTMANPQMQAEQEAEAIKEHLNSEKKPEQPVSTTPAQDNSVITDVTDLNEEEEPSTELTKV